MIGNKTPYLIVLSVLVLVAPAGAFDLVYTGDLVDRVPNTSLCAEATLNGFGIPAQVAFVGTNLYDVSRVAGPANTDTLGRICLPATWPADIYQVLAHGTENGGTAVSPPVALHLFTYYKALGLGVGGALFLDQQDVFPTTVDTLPEWRATLALKYVLLKPWVKPKNMPAVKKSWWFVLPRGCVEQLLYLDPLNPLHQPGGVRVTAKEFLNTQMEIKLTKKFPFFHVRTLKFYGYCLFERNGDPPVYKRFEVTLKKLPYAPDIIKDGIWWDPCFLFKLRVINFANDTIYEACEVIQDGAVKILL